MKLVKSNGIQLRELGLYRGGSRGGLIILNKDLKGECSKVRVGLFSQVMRLDERTKS